MEQITYRSPLYWQATDGTAVPDDTIITLSLDTGTIEVRHKGDYIEIHKTGPSSARLTIEPRVSNEVWLRVER